ncbi:MAG TPA: pilin [Candidatus Fimivivens sp.]|nr:pilin [Candidatus Fimivivens sp.]
MHRFRSLSLRLLSTAALTVVLFVPAVTRAAATCTDGTLMGGVCVPSGDSTGLPETPIGTVIINVMNWLLGMLGLIAIIMFVVAGYQYLTAAGDEKNTENAKNNIKYAVIGVAVALLGYTVIYTVQRIVEGTSTTY